MFIYLLADADPSYFDYSVKVDKAFQSEQEAIQALTDMGYIKVAVLKNTFVLYQKSEEECMYLIPVMVV